MGCHPHSPRHCPGYCLAASVCSRWSAFWSSHGFSMVIKITTCLKRILLRRPSEKALPFIASATSATSVATVPSVPFLPSSQNHSMPNNQGKTAIQSSHEKPSRPSRGRKMLKIIVLLILELGAFYVGPCTNYLRKIFYRIYSADVVIARQGNLSMEQRTLTLSMTTRTHFCYEPFMFSHFDYGTKKHTVVYSLDSPSENARLSEHRIVIDPTAEHFGEIRWSISDDNHRLQEYAPLFFPTMSPYNFKSLIHIHPDDVHYLEKPFLLQSGNQFQANTVLVIH